MKIVNTLLAIIAFTSTALADGPLMGWSSWNTYRVNINDSLIHTQAQAMVDLGLDSLGYRYVNIDDGFFGGRDPKTGELKFHPQRFPNGLTALVKEIHCLGLKAGIYSDAGLNTCGNFWDNDTIAQNVGLFTHELQDCKLLFDSIGFDRIKVDFCGGDERQNHQHLNLDPRQRYTHIRSTLDSLGHKDVKLSVCRWTFPGTWVSRIASDWRISPDINCSWESVLSIIRRNMYLSGYSSRGHYNDMDMLEIGRGLSPEEERTHFGLWCMMNSPLLIGCDLTSIPQQSLAILKNRNLIAINQDSLGEQAYPIKHIGEGIVLVRDLETVNGLKRAVALFNPTDTPLQMSVSAQELLFDSDITATDLFTDIQHGSLSAIEQTVEPHNSYIYLVEGTKRSHRTLYEAEATYVDGYQNIISPVEACTPYLRFDKRCGGGVYWANANMIIFPNVYVEKDGIYNFTVRINIPQPAVVTAMANSGEVVLDKETTDGFEEVKFSLLLKAGMNKVSINAKDNSMGIDYLRVSCSCA